jgi:hypothetical protein
MITSMATQAPSARLDTVGVCREGSVATTFRSFALGTFILRPTFSSARSAAFRSIMIFSIFVFFHLSLSAALLATTTVSDSRMVSTMRRLLATSEAPVSVTSTMASARSGGFASVAPQEYSTVASMFFDLRKRRVKPTSSVAIFLPLRPLMFLMGESAGTATTHLTPLKPTFPYRRRATSATLEFCSSTQSRPVMPMSRMPFST